MSGWPDDPLHDARQAERADRREAEAHGEVYDNPDDEPPTVAELERDEAEERAARDRERFRGR